MKRDIQLALRLPMRGGKRRGAGRKPKGPKALVSHQARARFDRASPVEVTLCVAVRVWNLRSQRCFRVIERSLTAARGRFGMRVIEFSVLGNHLHLIVEAESNEALSRGVQGLSIRIAKALNRLMSTRGAVFADHYHSRVLRSPTELVEAIAYVLENAAHHFGGDAKDPYSSTACAVEVRLRTVSAPTTWLLRTGWRRAKRLPPRFSSLWPIPT